MSISDSILKTLAYSDIFDYPLKDCEVWKYLIGDTKTGIEVVQRSLKIFTDLKRIYTDGEFFFLKGREKIVQTRKTREGWSKEKWQIAQKAASRLKIIPTIRMIGITGALAMSNCKKDDDIDLVIITSANTLWLTRFLIIILCSVLGIKRRKPNDKEINNKICFNLFLEENHLKIQPESLFLAREIVQVKPIYDQGGVYRKFIKENKWIEIFLPNTLSIDHKTIKRDNDITKKKGIAISLSRYLVIFEEIAFSLQYQYMKSKITSERVSRHQAFFHPNNLQDKIMSKYMERLRLLYLE